MFVGVSLITSEYFIEFTFLFFPLNRMRFQYVFTYVFDSSWAPTSTIIVYHNIPSFHLLNFKSFTDFEKWYLYVCISKYVLIQSKGLELEIL